MRKVWPEQDSAALDDDMLLRLIFTCCHPSFAAEVQVALTLRTVCGPLHRAGGRGAFLVGEEAMGQRLVRAKQKIKLAGIPYEVPERDALWPAAARRAGGDLSRLYRRLWSRLSGEALMRPRSGRARRSGWRACSTH